MKKRTAEKISAEVIKALSQQRELKKMSRYQLSKQTGISESSLSYIEKKSQQPSLTTLLMIADALETDLGRIISRLRKNQ